MSQTIQTQTFNLPSEFGCYLLYGDCSGLEDNEIKEIDEWMESKKPGYCTEVGESEFATINDFNNLAGDVAEFTFIC